MPCYDDRRDDPKYICEAVQKRADKATRAACEMARLVRKNQNLWGSLTLTTQKWIRAHEAFDRKEGR